MSFRLFIVFMLMLLPLQWGLAQAHDSAEEIRELVSHAQATSAPGMAATADSPLAHDGHDAHDVHASAAHAEQGTAHAQEPGGICQFHDFAHTVALAVGGDLGLGLPRLPRDIAGGASATRLAAGTPAQIDRPRWPHHGSSVVDFIAARPLI